MMTDTPENVSMVPIARIEVLNSRDRNMKVFEEIVESIQLIGLKKPITVAERAGEDGQLKYLLVCGEGRLNAFRILGETHIPALVVDVSAQRTAPSHDPVSQGRIASSGVLHHLSEKIPHYGKEHNNFRRDRDLELRQDLARLPGIGGAAELCEQGARDRRRRQHRRHD